MKQSTASTAQAPVGKPVHVLHPLTVIIIGASAWVTALSIPWPLLHAALIVVGWVAGIAGSRSLAVPATSIALSIPAGLSMLLVHAPHGEHQIAPLLTSDGLATAGELALRFCALMTSLLAAMANVHIPDLLKALQHLGLHRYVERAGRLVGDQQLRVEGQRPGRRARRVVSTHIEISAPSEVLGSCTPRPRNESDASSRIASPRNAVAIISK